MKVVRSSHSPERGEGRLGSLFTLLILAAGGYFAWENIPHYFHKVKMQEATTDIVRAASVRQTSERDIRNLLAEKALENNLPPGAAIEVRRNGKKVLAHISYTQEITMPFYKWEWPVNIQAQDTGF
ncbi:MAG: hypothetical protein ACKV2V_06485 [Blastocatellia bacterium]